jgi:hypothetical protein
MQATKHKEDINGCTTANYHHHKYQAYMSFAVARKEEHQQPVHYLALKKPPSHEELMICDSHQHRKNGFCSIRNIGWRSPPSLFNVGPETRATPPFRQTDPPQSSANTQQSRPTHSKRKPSLLPCHDNTLANRSHSNSLDSTSFSLASTTHPTSMDMD